MEIYEVRVTPEVARLRQGDAGTRNVPVVLTFSRQPTYYVGAPPAELAEDPGLEVRRLAAQEAYQALQHGALVNAHRCLAEGLVRKLGAASVAAQASVAPVTPAGDLVARVEALERAVADLKVTYPVEELEVVERLPELERDELVALHEQVLGKKPHGNARDESIRDAIRETLTAGAEKE